VNRAAVERTELSSGYWSLASRSALTRTPPIFLLLFALHVFLPIFPWWAMDLGAIVALAAL
jgi:hypothetical protein